MKKVTLILALMSTVMFLAPSCKKCDRDQPQSQALTQTVTASINENTSYTFTVPASNNQSPFQIATQATNYTISQISATAAGAVVYQYTPAVNYVGNDLAVLSNVAGSGVIPVTGPNGGCGQGGSNQGGGHQCNHGNDHDKDDMSSMTITINITVMNTSRVTSTNPSTTY